MWLETVRTIADWLNGDLHDVADAAQGVNVKLALVPRDAGDAQPAAVTVVDETRDIEAALKQAKAGVLGVSQYRQSSHGELPTVYRDGEIPIQVSLALTSADTAEASQAESYIMRAALWSLAELNRNENANVRRRNRVNLLDLSGIEVFVADGKIGDRDVTCAIRLIAKVRDTKPHGTEP